MCMIRPGTGTLMATFSERDSTRPTAPMLFAEVGGDGGATGGALLAVTGCIRMIENMARAKVIAAAMDKPCFNISLSSSYLTSQMLQPAGLDRRTLSFQSGHRS